MKKVILCILFLAIMLSCTGCLPEYVFVTGYYEAFHLVTADVPFADSTNKIRFDNVKKLEEDEYGRCLYSYGTGSAMFGYSYLNIYIISQKETQTEIYYYPDYCYIARYDADDPFSEEEIARLLERNDWDKPLNEEKMRKIPNDDLGWIARYGDFTTALRDYLRIGKEDSIIIHPMEINDANQQMIFYLVIHKTEIEGKWTSASYISVYQADSDRPIVAIEEVEDSFDCQDTIHDFRTTWFEPEA